MPLSARPVLPLPGPLLQILEKLWRWGVSQKKRRESAKFRSGEWPLRLPVPVISLGNITVGGTGKTPTVLALAKAWKDLGGRPGILSRGYGTESRPRAGSESGSRQSVNDEFQMLQEKLPDVPHFQHKDRFHVGKLLLTKHPEVDLLLLDDGFQHRRLYRDLNILLCDAQDPFGGGYCLPLGRLREPIDAVSEADHILLTRTERCSPEWLDQVTGYFRQLHPQIPVDLCQTRVLGFRPLDGGDPVPAEVDSCLAFSALGDPDGFLNSLQSTGIRVLKEVRYQDHRHFSERDLDQLLSLADQNGCQALVCTAKDSAKVAELGLPEPLRRRILVLEIEHDFPVEAILSRWTAGQP